MNLYEYYNKPTYLSHYDRIEKIYEPLRDNFNITHSIDSIHGSYIRKLVGHNLVIFTINEDRFVVISRDGVFY